MKCKCGANLEAVTYATGPTLVTGLALMLRCPDCLYLAHPATEALGSDVGSDDDVEGNLNSNRVQGSPE